jgi:putative DNA primase/helicase
MGAVSLFICEESMSKKDDDPFNFERYKSFDLLSDEEKRKIIDDVNPDHPLDSPAYLNQNYILINGTDYVYDRHTHDMLRYQSAKRRAFNSFRVWEKSRKKIIVNWDKVIFDATLPSNLFYGQDMHGEEALYINLFDISGIPRPMPQDHIDNEVIHHCRGLLRLLCNQDEELFNWCERWIAYPIQHIGAKMKTSILAASPLAGTGKNLFFDQLIGRMYGNYYGVIGSDQLHLSYNDWLSRKLYIVADEVIEGSEDRYRLKGKIKAMITQDKFSISEKYKPNRMERNQVNLVFLSNEVIALALDSNDRRINYIRPEIKESKEYYNHMWRVIDTKWRHYFSYLVYMDLHGFRDNQEPYQSEDRQELMEESDPTPVRFAREWIRRDTKWDVGIVLKRDFYTAYGIWCQERYLKPRPDNMFFLEIKGIVKVKRIHPAGGTIYKVVYPSDYDKDRDVTHNSIDALELKSWLQGRRDFVG